MKELEDPTTPTVGDDPGAWAAKDEGAAADDVVKAVDVKVVVCAAAPLCVEL